MVCDTTNLITLSRLELHFLDNLKKEKVQKALQGVNVNIYFCDQEEYVTFVSGVNTLHCTNPPPPHTHTQINKTKTNKQTKTKTKIF